MNNCVSKETYTVPQIEVIRVTVNSSILSGSNDDIGGEDL
jgi:hypothetical protein